MNKLPRYKELSQKEYAQLMMKKLEAKRQAIVEARAAKGLGFVGRDKLLQTVPGSLPKNTKTLTIDDHRAKIPTECAQTRDKLNDWYFGVYFAYKAASKDYRAGKPNVVFPHGTYPPHLPCNLKIAA